MINFELGTKSMAILISAILFFLYFLLIFNVPLGVFPDENEHFRLISEAAKDGIFDSTFSASQLKAFGPLETKSYLYYKLSSWLYGIFSDDHLRLITIRFISFLSTIGYLIYSYKLISKFYCSRFFTLFAVASIQLTYSVIYMGSAVSWDAPANFASIATIFYTYKLIDGLSNSRSINLNIMVLLLFFSNIGILLKWSSALVNLICGSIVFAYLLYAKYKNEEISFRYKFSFLGLLATVAAFATLFLALKHYLPVLLNYGKFNPSCIQVWGKAECMQFYNQDRVHYQLIEDHTTNAFKSFVEYFPIFVDLNISRLYGFFGHANLASLESIESFSMFFLTLFFLMFIFLIATKVSAPNKNKFSRNQLIGILILILFLSAYYIQNYAWYSQIKVVGAAVQGRYFLPIYPIIIGIVFSWIEQCKFKLASLLIAFTIPFTFFAIGLGRDTINGNLRLLFG